MSKAFYYGDLLRDYEKRYTKGYYNGKPVYLKFRTAPSESVSFAQTYRVSRSVEVRDGSSKVDYNSLNGSTVKTSCHSNQVSSKFKFINNAFTYEVGYKPSEWNNAEKNLQLKHTSRFDTSTHRIDSTESLKVGLPQVGPLRIW